MMLSCAKIWIDSEENGIPILKAKTKSNWWWRRYIKLETEKILEGFREHCLLKDHGPIIIATFYQHLIHPFSLINDILVLPALFFWYICLSFPLYHIITEWWWYFLNRCRLKLPLLMYLIFLIWYKENSLQAASIH